MSRFSKLSFAAFALSSLATASRASAQAPSEEQPGPVTLALAVGNQRYDETKPGQCKHAPKASIYGTDAAMWTVQYSPSATTSISLTLWRPVGDNPSEQVRVNISSGSAKHYISTVKGASLAGRATVSFKPHGAGGRFEINGVTAAGIAIRGSIDCARITPLTAVGGD